MSSISKLIQTGNIDGISQLKNLQKTIKGHISGNFDTKMNSLTNPSMLQLAAAYHQEKVVEYLLKWQADPNALNVF
ncbi:hypothetical protein TRFO_21182 [Tritrichomonas foetus]|uniref:Ankyrin repeat protein n=1 Tax=Tritrichomonas foetus TaxID=1144522 RepID=A0A1J4KEA3_9EUKA|nr:hypothetical protein TRFO_21182 [Tritrichomonas foetus]|eukprot:OHT09761.1 hypothetical protein TRFO_21182 [Tritrichomonas foetus]